MTDLPDIRDIREMISAGHLPRYLRMLGGMNAPTDRSLEKVRCPHCGAAPMQSCTTPQGGHLSAGIHEARVQASSALPSRQNATPAGVWPTRKEKPPWPNR